MIYPLAPNGIFWTIQGEGALSGGPMAFVRLAGCSVGCADCDTDYRVDQRLETSDIIRHIESVIPQGFRRPDRVPAYDFQSWVWITGGEPTDHDLGPLVDALQTIGFRVALATAGVKNVMQLKVQWISVSPHSLDALQKWGHELKVVPGLNGLSWSDIEKIDREWHSFPYRYIQPLSEGRSSLDACIKFVKTHPGWRLGSQAHKGWKVP